ncbi:hypothetical protein ALO_04378, partial [Acetonema longum DSM 6540]
FSREFLAESRSAFGEHILSGDIANAGALIVSILPGGAESAPLWGG